jgi:hypothetical protein
MASTVAALATTADNHFRGVLRDMFSTCLESVAPLAIS